MKLLKNTKHMVAVAVLAVSIPVAGVAYAFPAQQMPVDDQTKGKTAVVDQMTPGAGQMANQAQFSNMNASTHNPAKMAINQTNNDVTKKMNVNYQTHMTQKQQKNTQPGSNNFPQVNHMQHGIDHSGSHHQGLGHGEMNHNN